MSRISPPRGTRQREPRKHDRSYLGFIARLPCVACAVAGRANFQVEVMHCKLPIAVHGWRGAGHSEKSDDRKTTPGCAYHHREGPAAQHRIGERQYWDALGICPACLCEALESAYEAGESGIAVIWTAVRGRRRDGQPTC